MSEGPWVWSRSTCSLRSRPTSWRSAAPVTRTERRREDLDALRLELAGEVVGLGLHRQDAHVERPAVVVAEVVEDDALSTAHGQVREGDQDAGTTPRGVRHGHRSRSASGGPVRTGPERMHRPCVTRG